MLVYEGVTLSRFASLVLIAIIYKNDINIHE